MGVSTVPALFYIIKSRPGWKRGRNLKPAKIFVAGDVVFFACRSSYKCTIFRNGLIWRAGKGARPQSREEKHGVTEP